MIKVAVIQKGGLRFVVSFITIFDNRSWGKTGEGEGTQGSLEGKELDM